MLTICSFVWYRLNWNFLIDRKHCSSSIRILAHWIALIFFYSTSKFRYNIFGKFSNNSSGDFVERCFFFIENMRKSVYQVLEQSILLEVTLSTRVYKFEPVQDAKETLLRAGYACEIKDSPDRIDSHYSYSLISLPTPSDAHSLPRSRLSPIHNRRLWIWKLNGFRSGLPLTLIHFKSVRQVNFASLSNQWLHKISKVEQS